MSRSSRSLSETFIFRKWNKLVDIWGCARHRIGQCFIPQGFSPGLPHLDFMQDIQADPALINVVKSCLLITSITLCSPAELHDRWCAQDEGGKPQPTLPAGPPPTYITTHACFSDQRMFSAGPCLFFCYFPPCPMVQSWLGEGNWPFEMISSSLPTPRDRHWSLCLSVNGVCELEGQHRMEMTM